MSANPETLIAIFVMAAAAMAAKDGGFVVMRWLGRHRFVSAWLDHAPGAVMAAAAVVPIVQNGGAFVGVITTRTLGGFTPGLFSSVGAVALGRWLSLS